MKGLEKDVCRKKATAMVLGNKKLAVRTHVCCKRVNPTNEIYLFTDVPPEIGVTSSLS